MAVLGTDCMSFGACTSYPRPMPACSPGRLKLPPVNCSPTLRWVRIHHDRGLSEGMALAPLAPIARPSDVARKAAFFQHRQTLALLTPCLFADAPCLYLIDDWWTYEYCPLRHVRQIHREGTRTTVDHLLGLYDETKPTIVKRVRRLGPTTRVCVGMRSAAPTSRSLDCTHLFLSNAPPRREVCSKAQPTSCMRARFSSTARRAMSTLATA